MKKLLFAIVMLVAVVASAAQYSKLSIILASKQMGKWDALKSWISAAGLTDEFQNCAYLSDEMPQYALLTNALVKSGIATDAEIVQILAASKDTAVPEAMLRRVYETDMSNSTGRVKWHGSPVSVRFDTNRLVKVTTYADGYVYERAFASASAMPIDERVSKAERAAAAERRKQAEARRQAKIKADRIALLQTNMTAEVSALMLEKRWPEDLARAWLRNELNTLIGTQTVNGVVTPKGE